MPALMQNASMKVGDSLTISFGPITNPDGSFTDLSGGSGKWALATSETGNTLLMGLTTGSPPAGIPKITNPVTLTSANFYGATAWSLNVPLIPADTVGVAPTIPPNKYYHEAEVTDAFGNNYTIATGDFRLYPSIINNPKV